MTFLRRIIPGSKFAQSLALTEKLVSSQKTTKVVKGGRNFTYAVTVIVGDGNGRFGFGRGKAKEMVNARKKAFNSAKKRLHSVAIRDKRTVSHTVMGSCGASSVLIRPARPGTGVIAGGAVKQLLEIIGFKDVVCKSFGSSANKNAMVIATIDALSQLCSISTLASLRGKTPSQLLRKTEVVSQPEESQTTAA
jgi:small subunit ribosomal protein S5